jgi:hypothetical protein
MNSPTFWLRILVFVCLPLQTFGQHLCGGLNFIGFSQPNSPGQFIGQASAYDTYREVAVLFGGHNPLTGVPHIGDTWEWDGASWLRRTSGSSHARKDAAMAYDTHRRVCVLFGGGTNVFQHQIPFNDTWEWDGSVWTMRQAHDPAATDRPPPLDYPKMTYDSRRRRMVLIGSTERVGGQVNPVTRTWEWDGNTWSVHPSALPSRFQPSMVYDPVRRVTVVFGGNAYVGGLLDDTWTWDGTNWTRVAVGGPPPREEHAMVFDTRRGLMILVGGSAGGPGDELNDVWEWNGQSWSLDGGLYAAPRRRLHQMWYDPGQEVVFLFGGTYSFRRADGGFNHYISDEMEAGWPPGPWIDFGYSGDTYGTVDYPYKTLAEAVAEATPGCVLNLRAGSTAETITISKSLTLRPYDGPVTIGQ